MSNRVVLQVACERFTDVGFATIDRERTLQSLTQHFEALGRRLPDGQTLRVEVLDVNLAGEVWPRGPSEVRVLRGRADDAVSRPSAGAAMIQASQPFTSCPCR